MPSVSQVLATTLALGLLAAPAIASEDATTSPDLLPGVDLVTEEVEPGVYRVLSDGVRKIGRDATSLMVDPDGAVWLTRSKRTHGKETQVAGDNLWRIRVIRLGEPGISLDNRRVRQGRHWWKLTTDDEGSVFLQGEEKKPRGGEHRVWEYGEAGWEEVGTTAEMMTFDECARGYRDGRAPRERRIAADGACWFVNPAIGTPVRLTADGERSEDIPVDLGVEGYGRGVVVDDEGTVWTAIEAGTFDPEPDEFGGFVTFDGEEWTHIPYEPADEPVGGVSGLFAGPDGGMWAVSTDREAARLLLAGWDGDRWTTHVLPYQGNWPWRHRLPDGGVVIGGDAIFDGTELRTWEILSPELRIQELANAPDGSTWGLASTDDDPWGTSLYVITPEAVAAAE